MNGKAWNDEEEAELIKLYTEDELDIQDIADHFGKKTRSIISKLVQLKIYRKPEDEKTSKRSVKSMVIELENILGIDIEGLNLTKKSNLEKVVDGIKLKIQESGNLK